MAAADAEVRSIGRLGPTGPWVGVTLGDGGDRLVFGLADGSIVADATADADERRIGLVAAAMAYYTEALEQAPDDLAATQEDMARLIRRLSSGGSGSPSGAEIEVVEAIDDGLPGEAVARRLTTLLPDPGVDPVVLLTARLEQALARRG